MIGTHTVTDPVAGTPHRALLPYPICHTRTMAPKAEPTEAALRATALAASTTDRKARVSSTRVKRAMRPSMSGKLPYTAWMKSACSGPAPPTPMTPGSEAAAAWTALTVAPPEDVLGSAMGRTSTIAVPPRRNSGLVGAKAV